MAYFSPVEWARVALVRADVRAAVLKTMNDFETATGLKTFVPENGGYRGEGVQAAIYADSLASGFRAAPAGSSPHEYGAAIDLQIVGTSQDPARDHADPRYKQLADCGRANGLRAGFYFTSGLPDPYHLEAPETLSAWQAAWGEEKKNGSSSLRRESPSRFSSSSAGR